MTGDLATAGPALPRRRPFRDAGPSATPALPRRRPFRDAGPSATRRRPARDGGPPARTHRTKRAPLPRLPGSRAWRSGFPDRHARDNHGQPRDRARQPLRSQWPHRASRPRRPGNPAAAPASRDTARANPSDQTANPPPNDRVTASQPASNDRNNGNRCRAVRCCDVSYPRGASAGAGTVAGATRGKLRARHAGSCGRDTREAAGATRGKLRARHAGRRGHDTPGAGTGRALVKRCWVAWRT
jgi:hypothetical protein